MMSNEFKIVRNIFASGVNERVYTWEQEDVAIIFCPISTSGEEHPQYRGDNKKLFPRVPVLIDLADFDIVKEAPSVCWKITISKFSVYATSGWGKMTPYLPNQKLRMHQLLAQPEGDYVVDHCFHHYGLDNRRGNLVVTTRSENAKNRVFRNDPQELIVPEVDTIIAEKGPEEAVRVLRLFNSHWK